MTLTILQSSWLSLNIAILFGVMGTISMKLSHGLQKWKPAVCMIVFYIVSFAALTIAMKYIDLSVVYAVWSGVGTILMAAIGVFYFNESISIRKIIYLALIVIGIIGIHLSDGIISF